MVVNAPLTYNKYTDVSISSKKIFISLCDVYISPNCQYTPLRSVYFFHIRLVSIHCAIWRNISYPRFLASYFVKLVSGSIWIIFDFSLCFICSDFFKFKYLYNVLFKLYISCFGVLRCISTEICKGLLQFHLSWRMLLCNFYILHLSTSFCIIIGFKPKIEIQIALDRILRFHYALVYFYKPTWWLLMCIKIMQIVKIPFIQKGKKERYQIHGK